MINYPLNVAKAIGSKKILVVTPPKNQESVVSHLKDFPFVKIVEQKKPLGTADAVKVCAPALNQEKGYVVILCGDTPLIKSETLKSFIARVKAVDATLGFVTTRVENPTGYGRVVRDAAEEVERIVEEKEATPAEKNIKEVNTGIYCVKSGWLFSVLKTLKPHPVTGEYYLTDIVEAAIEAGEKTVGFLSEDAEAFMGVNTPAHLALANEGMRDRIIGEWMAKGVSFLDPRHVYLESDVAIGAGTIIHPQVYLYGKTKIGKNCVIECGAILKNMIVGEGVHIKPYCVLEESRIENDAVVGPFARLRPGSHVGAQCRIGNFVELKKTKMGAGAKANHLSYLGDATIGAGTNIGCGTITCNYDGVKKHQTKIGKKVFVGSDVQFVAPVTIGDGAYIGAGSTITENVPAGSLGIARGRQVNKKNYVRNHRLHRKT